MDASPKTTRTRKTASSAKTAATATRPRSRAKAEANDAPSHEQIALRAHELYVRSGHQQGREQEFWLEAERQLLDEAKTVGV
jgi:hypothetical protein